MARSNHLKPGTGKPTLAERTAAMHTKPPLPGGQHIFLRTDLGNALPALLIEQRRGPDGWEARIAYVTEVRPGKMGVITEWVPAARLSKTSA